MLGGVSPTHPIFSSRWRGLQIPKAPLGYVTPTAYGSAAGRRNPQRSASPLGGVRVDLANRPNEVGSKRDEVGSKRGGSVTAALVAGPTASTSCASLTSGCAFNCSKARHRVCSRSSTRSDITGLWREPQTLGSGHRIA